MRAAVQQSKETSKTGLYKKTKTTEHDTQRRNENYNNKKIHQVCPQSISLSSCMRVSMRMLMPLSILQHSETYQRIKGKISSKTELDATRSEANRGSGTRHRKSTQGPSASQEVIKAKVYRDRNSTQRG